VLIWLPQIFIKKKGYILDVPVCVDRKIFPIKTVV